MDPARTERLLAFARDLFAAEDASERAELAARAAAAVLSGRGVTVQLYRPGGAVHAHAGPEMSAVLRRRRLGAKGDPIGEIVVDGTGLAAEEEAALERVADLLRAAVEAAGRDLSRRRALAAGLRVAAGLASERDPAGPDLVARRAAYARLIGEALAPEGAGEWLGELELAALLAGVGRAHLPAELLRPGRAPTAAERALIEEHELRGARALAAEAELRPAARVAREHRLRFDEGGDSEPPCLAARVVAVALAYARRTTPPPRGDGLSHAEALASIEREAGGSFDPRVVEALRARGQEVDAVRRRTASATACAGSVA